MDFDDFKRDWERFSIIDTDQKLAFCKTRYESYILSVEDAEYFEPVKVKHWLSNLTEIYDKNLRAIFSNDYFNESQACYLAVTSFDPEYILILRQETDYFVLTYSILTTNYWSEYYSDQQILTVPKTDKSIIISEKTGERLLSFIDFIINDARVPEVGTYVLDGTQYFLSKTINKVPAQVFKHSPDENSRSGRVIQFFEQIIHMIKDPAHSEISSELENNLTALLNSWKK